MLSGLVMKETTSCCYWSHSFVIRPLEERVLCPFKSKHSPKITNKTITTKRAGHIQNTSTPLYFPLFSYGDGQLMATTLRNIKKEV